MFGHCLFQLIPLQGNYSLFQLLPLQDIKLLPLQELFPLQLLPISITPITRH